MLPRSSTLKSLNDGAAGGKVVDLPSTCHECRAIAASVANTRGSHTSYRIRPPLSKGNLRLHCLFGEINTRPPSRTFHSILYTSFQEKPFARTPPRSPDSESWPHPAPSLWTPKPSALYGQSWRWIYLITNHTMNHELTMDHSEDAWFGRR